MCLTLHSSGKIYLLCIVDLGVVAPTMRRNRKHASVLQPPAARVLGNQIQWRCPRCLNMSRVSCGPLSDSRSQSCSQVKHLSERRTPRPELHVDVMKKDSRRAGSWAPLSFPSCLLSYLAINFWWSMVSNYVDNLPPFKSYLGAWYERSCDFTLPPQDDGMVVVPGVRFPDLPKCRISARTVRVESFSSQISIENRCYIPL